MENRQQLHKAQEGDIHAFQSLFVTFQDSLKSYLFRLMANRADAEDLAHDTFIKAFDKLASFEGKSSLKTWVFQIATHLAYNELKKRKRWVEDVKTQAKGLVMSKPELQASLTQINQTSPYGAFDLKEHIDTGFTCMAKTLPVENQVAIILKDVYDFSVKEIMLILGKTEGVVKYLLQNARKTLMDIFDRRCALVNKAGVCHQCSELNGWFNPKQDQQVTKMKVKLVREAASSTHKALFQLRMELVKAIDPLRTEGHELQTALLDCNRRVMGELG